MNSYWVKYIYVKCLNLTACIGRKYFWPHLAISLLNVISPSYLPVELICYHCQLPPTAIKLSGVLMMMFTHHLDRDSYWWKYFSHLHPHSTCKRQGRHKTKKFHHTLRHGSHSLPSGRRDRVRRQAQGWLIKHPKGDRDVIAHAAVEEMMSWEHCLCLLNVERWF